MNSRFQSELQFQGCLLVAAPDWESELYARSVCLLVHHDKQGSVGVVLNRSFNAEAPDLWKHLSGNKTATSRPLHFGGPVSGPVIALHNRQELAEVSPGDGVYIAAQLTHLQQLVDLMDESEVRLIIGQAAWAPGQLEAELQAGRWYPVPVSPQLVFACEDEMWARAMRDIGNRYVVAISGATGQPANPMLN